MARQDAAPLIALADKITREGACAQARDIRALTALRIKLVNAHKIPARLQEPLSSGVNALVAQTPPCLPTIPAATIETTPTAPVPDFGWWKHKRKKHDHRDEREGGD
jgi:hypothetical protein